MSEFTLPIYLDYNATTPHAPEVIEAMRPYLELHFGNPSSFFDTSIRKARLQYICEYSILSPSSAFTH